MHRFYSYCAQLIGGMIVCLLIISFSVTLTLNFRPLYYADIQHLSLIHICKISSAFTVPSEDKRVKRFGSAAIRLANNSDILDRIVVIERVTCHRNQGSDASR